MTLKHCNQQTMLPHARPHVGYKRNGDTKLYDNNNLYNLAFHKISLKDIASISYYFSSKNSTMLYCI